MSSYANVGVLYVSQKTGHTNYTGLHYVNDAMLSGPLPSIEEALIKVAQMRRAGYMQPVSIKLLDEEYCFEKTLEIGMKDINLSAFPIDCAAISDITIEPFQKDKVVFSGARKLTGFKDDVFNGHQCWSIELDDVKKGKWDFTDLYVNNIPAKRTRYPQEGVLYPESVDERKDCFDMFFSAQWFIAKENDIPDGFKSINNAKIKFCHYWVEEQLDVAEYDFSTRKCTFVGKTAMAISEKCNEPMTMAYYIENLAEAFGQEGDFYLDKTNGILYYKPRKGENKEETVIYAPMIKTIVSLDGGNDGLKRVFFKNIKFAYTKGDYYPVNEKNEIIGSDPQCVCGLHGAIEVKNSQYCGWDDCEFFAIGGHGVKIKEGCHHIEINNCLIQDLGGGAIAINGGELEMPQEAWTHDIKVCNCEITRLGQRYICACGILLQHGYDCEFSNNTIHDLYYSGICLGWVWGYKPSITRGNKVYKNHIYDLGKGILSDMGGVYTLGRQDGTVVSHNVIHDIQSRDYGGWALYADEGSQNIVFENNICYNVSENCFHLHYGRMNVVCNNVFAEAGHSLIKITHKEAQTGVISYNNVFISNGKPVYFGCTPLNFSTDNNLIITDEPNPIMYKMGESKTVKETEPDTLKEGEFIATLNEVKTNFGWDIHSKVEKDIGKSYEEFLQEIKKK